jgi:hypothetical protein
MNRTLSVMGAVVAVLANATLLQAQSSEMQSTDRALSDSVAHRVRTGGIVGATLGLTAGVVGGSMLHFSDGGSQARGVIYVGASGAVLGWVVGTIATFPFHGRNVVGPNDVRNATVTGGVVGFMTGVAAGALIGFKGNSSPAIAMIPLSGLMGAGFGAAIGHGVGTALPH